MNQLPTQPDQAIEMYRQLVRAQPESVEHRIQLGRLLETSGDFAAAIDVWRALDLNRLESPFRTPAFDFCF